ncbi:MAG: PaaI family thioesterase [Rhizobiales bacterium]|nr:PaaI family thioesterase [Hyphomicrobiales bacterium]MBN9003723.1 PaaI family thioesterase [Hyphomicrobiales bacterium]
MSAIADTAVGYAAVSLMPPDTAALTTELKINFMARASGERIVARDEVVKAGRTLTLVRTNVFTEAGGTRKLIALLVATIIMLEAKGDFSD